MAGPQVGWLSAHFQPPDDTKQASAAFLRPPTAPQPSQQVAPHMEGIRTDEALAAFLADSRPGIAVVEYGTSWCHKCHEIFPAFYQLSRRYPQHRYAVAQVEGMPGAVKRLRYTPTFAIYRDGCKVDEVVGNKPQRLADHLWLWA